VITQELSICSVRVNCIVTEEARNLVLALNPDELTETVQILSGEKASRVKCGCHSASLALENIG
jgi:hypothetical protein